VRVRLSASVWMGDVHERVDVQIPWHSRKLSGPLALALGPAPIRTYDVEGVEEVLGLLGPLSAPPPPPPP
jgi:hypothetical protein